MEITFTSHHKLGAFLSGQDMKMVQQEGEDTNCFVSLVVDTKGTYVAIITRKVQTKSEVTIKSLGTSYEFFGEGSRDITKDGSETTKTVDKETIEYFDLEVERHEVANTLEYLDTRFDEITKKKTENAFREAKNTPLMQMVDFNRKYDSFDNWIKKPSIDKDSIEPKYNKIYLGDGDGYDDWLIRNKRPADEPFLFGDDTMKSLEVGRVTKEDEEKFDEIIPKWTPDPEKIHQAAVRIVLGTTIVSPQKVDLKQWIKKFMYKKYEEAFGENGDYESITNASGAFNEWKDFIIQYTLDYFDDSDVPSALLDEGIDVFYSIVAQAIYDELFQFAENNTYIQAYCDALESYIVA